jgi:hypothetical protein
MRKLRTIASGIVLLSLVSCASVPSAQGGLCSEIAAFANVTKENSVQTVELVTDWGGLFAEKKPGEYIMASKTCNDFGYHPGKALCSYLLKNTSTEFADANLKSVMVCLGAGKENRLVTDTEFLQAKLWSDIAYGVRPGIRVGVEFSSESDKVPPTLRILAKKDSN